MNDTPLKGIVRNILLGALIAIVYMIVMAWLGRFYAGFLPAYLCIGASFSFFGWGGERLWHAALKNFFHEPFSHSALLSRIPVWGVFGGMAYTISAVFSKKFGAYPFEIIPVKNIFFAGAAGGCCIQAILYYLESKHYHHLHKEPKKT